VLVAEPMTTADVEPVSAPSWAIRHELPVDIDQIHDLHRAAFSGAAEAELVDAIRASAGFVPELSMVAVAEDGSVLGHVLVSRVDFVPADEARARADVLALAPLAVLPAHQNRGIGRALMTSVLAAADARPEPFVAVLGSPGFYGQFGFSPAADAGIQSPYDEAGPAYQVRPTGEGGLVPGTVSYPAAFGSL
jgi:putative acetyltransferase